MGSARWGCRRASARRLRSGAIALNAVKATILLAGERFQQVAERYFEEWLAGKAGYEEFRWLASSHRFYGRRESAERKTS